MGLVSAPLALTVRVRHTTAMDDIQKAELVLIRLKVAEGIAAADRGDVRELTDAVIEEILAKAQRLHAQHYQDLLA